METPLTPDLIQELAAGYVLGDLDLEEAERFQELLQGDPQLQVEVAQLQATLGAVAFTIPLQEPPPGLRNRIVGKFSPRFPRWVSLVSWLVGGLGVAAAFVVGVDNWRLRTALSGTSSVATLLQQDNLRLVRLQGAEGRGPAGSFVFVAGQWATVGVAVRDLPLPPGGQVYRLWAEFSDGSRIACGELHPNASGELVAQLAPASIPAADTKVTAIYATLDPVNSPLQPLGKRILTGVLTMN